MSIGFISHPACALHDMGGGHPESPARLAAIQDRLVASGLDLVLRHHDAPRATREQLTRVHTEAYVDGVFAEAPTEGRVWLDPDTSMNPHSLEAALRAAGAVVSGVERVMVGEHAAVFCCVRPPGHHATRNRAMGFCIFNNVAVGAAHALAAHGLERLAIVDFDVHHGNGTEDIVGGDERILFCSTFQHPYYPYSGDQSTGRNIISVPLPAGTGGEAFRTAVSTHWLPALESFAPQLILFSAGFDGHAEDDMADFMLTEADFGWVTAQVKAVADRHARGRIVSSLEGGYALDALGRSVAAHLDALIGGGGR